MTLQIYSPKQSKRLKYTLELIFTHILVVDYILTTSIEDLALDEAILNYSTEKIPNSLQIIPHNILFEGNIQSQFISVEDNYYFFRTNGEGIKYDILAASFFMTSRYEEYLNPEKDLHNRFHAENSIAFRNNFLDKAVVNRWALEIKEQLLSLSPSLSFTKQRYQYLSTIDIDNAYAYKAKGIKRLFGGFLKAVLRKDIDDIKARFSYLFLGKKDPFDVFDEIEEIHKKHNINSIFFFLVGENGPLDKNIQITKRAYKKLIQHISSKTKIGIERVKAKYE